MSETTLQEFVERKDYSRIHSSIEIPDLIEIQKRSYEEFLQREVEPERRKDHGLQAALASVFPIPDYNNTAVLEFTSYTLGTPKYDERECLEQGMTYAVPLKLRVRLVVFDKEDKGSKKKVLDVREQEVYVGELPLMTERGTFLINGTERVVVSQLHRSPGASFTHDKGRTHASGKVLYEKRLERAGQVYASPVLADGKLYYTSRGGRTFVLAAQPTFEQLAINDLGERTMFNAGVAIADRQIYLRSDKHLYCIEQK